MRKMLLGFALLACGIAFAPSASAEPSDDPGKDSAALVSFASADPVISARDDVIAVPEVASIPNDHEAVMRYTVAGAPVLPAVADPERTCQSPAFASLTDHAVTSNTDTLKTAADGRHGVSWRLQGRDEVWSFGAA